MDFEITKIEVGDLVFCDVCDKNYTESNDSGGFLFGSYAYCPECAIRALPDIKHHSEEHHIKAVCPENISFADFVRNGREAMNHNG